MIEGKRRKGQIILLVLAVITIILTLGHFFYIRVFNSTVHEVVGAASEEDTYMDLHFRGDNTSSWHKMDMNIDGIVYDGTLYNNSPYMIDSWTLRININQDCYINQFWNGSVEIHQHVDYQKETVQKFNMADYDKETLRLDYLYSGSDLLVPLKKGDFIIYHPNTIYKEEPVNAHDNVVVGVIFYYKGGILDVSDYTLEYKYRRDFTEGLGFILVCISLIAFVIVFLSNQVLLYIYKKAEKEAELRISGLSSMSELYSVIYIVDLLKDTIKPVSTDENSEKNRPRNLGANEQLQNLFSIDAEEAYKGMMLDFADLSTLPRRMENKNTLSAEYLSKMYGWNRIRFIAMDRKEGEPLETVLFTIEQINEEKKEIDEALSQIERVEMESRAKSAFLANMSHEIRTPINTILGLDTMIIRESKEDKVLSYARDIKSAGNILLSLINSILDYSKIEAGKVRLIQSEYSLKELVFGVQSIIKAKVEEKGIEFEIDIAENIPDSLYGDDVHIKQVIINLLTNAVNFTEKGRVRLGMFGKMVDDNTIHLLVSVKDTGKGITPDYLKALNHGLENFEGDKGYNKETISIGMNLVRSLLELMDSKLKVASIYGKGSDFYFEVEQKILDPKPIGLINWDEREDNDDYGKSFIAPDANILIVDDNAMSLRVFEE
nr:hypothetical protein [Lachnospiraceae bacterium]